MEVFDGRGRAWAAWLESVDASGAVLRLGEERLGASGRTVVLIQGLPKGDKMDLVLQKSTELGVTGGVAGADGALGLAAETGGAGGTARAVAPHRRGGRATVGAGGGSGGRRRSGRWTRRLARSGRACVC